MSLDLRSYHADIQNLVNAYVIGNIIESRRLEAKLSVQGVSVDYGPDGVCFIVPARDVEDN